MGVVIFGLLAVALICGAQALGWMLASQLDRWMERRRWRKSQADRDESEARFRQYREWFVRIGVR